MPSSISSSDLSDAAAPYARVLPSIRLGRVWTIAAIFAIAGLAAWEAKWRAFGALPSYANSDGAWAIQRRRIDHGEGKKTVLIGSSRVLFDIQLDTWQRGTGERPIQLALEGTSPILALEDLADDPKFIGRLLVGVSPPLFFSDFGLRKKAIENWRRETPAQRWGQWLSMHLVEPFFAFDDPDFALMKVLERQPWWPERAGVHIYRDVRRLSEQDIDRNTHLWQKVEDPEYQQLAKSIWRQIFAPPPGVTREMADQLKEKQIERAVAAVKKLRARGVQVVFIRAPVVGEFLEAEDKGFPRATTWDVLLTRTGVSGIHFEDYPQLQGYNLPEWSHMTEAEAERFTAALCGVLERTPGWSAPTDPAN